MAFKLAELFVEITQRDARYRRSLGAIRTATARAGVQMAAAMARATASMRRSFVRFGRVARRVMTGLARWAKRGAIAIAALSTTSVIQFGRFELAMARGIGAAVEGDVKLAQACRLYNRNRT